MGDTAHLTLVEPRDIDPPTRLKLKWEQVHKQAAKTELEKDTGQAEAMAEAAEAGMTHQEIAVCVGIHQSRVDQLLRYQRFNTFLESLTTIVVKIPEGRFRAYWQQMSDPQDRRKGDKAKRRDYERKVFCNILTYLEAGKPPIKKPKPFEPPTVEEMMKKKKPLTALRKEVNRRFTQEFKPLAATLRDYLGRDRASYAPNLMAHAAIALEKWERSFEELLKQFDTYVQE